jgi:hypothetical protein
MNFMIKNSVNPCKSSSNNRMDTGFDVSSKRTADIGCKPVRLMNSLRGLCLWMQKALKTPESKQNPRNPRLTKDLPLYICKESSTNQPFYAKQTQFVEAEIAISLCLSKRYANSTFLSKAKNKPNSNPNEPKLGQIRENRKTHLFFEIFDTGYVTAVRLLQLFFSKGCELLE